MKTSKTKGLDGPKWEQSPRAQLTRRAQSKARPKASVRVRQRGLKDIEFIFDSVLSNVSIIVNRKKGEKSPATNAVAESKGKTATIELFPSYAAIPPELLSEK